MSLINKVIGVLLTLWLAYLILARAASVNQILGGLGDLNARTLQALRS